MVFPGNQIDRKWTINQARGCNRTIADRFDLTLECIRRHYQGQPSPLGETLARYGDLQDRVTNDGSAVMFCMPFDDFKSPSVPKDRDTYTEYRCRSIDFI